MRSVKKVHPATKSRKYPWWAGGGREDRKPPAAPEPPPFLAPEPNSSFFQWTPSSSRSADRMPFSFTSIKAQRSSQLGKNKTKHFKGQVCKKGSQSWCFPLQPSRLATEARASHWEVQEVKGVTTHRFPNHQRAEEAAAQTSPREAADAGCPNLHHFRAPSDYTRHPGEARTAPALGPLALLGTRVPTWILRHEEERAGGGLRQRRVLRVPAPGARCLLLSITLSHPSHISRETPGRFEDRIGRKSNSVLKVRLPPS